MQVFTSEEFQRRPAEVQQSALVEPAFITFHGRPRLVMMSVDAFDRLRGGGPAALGGVVLPDDMLADVQALVGEQLAEGDDPGLIGGLLDEPGEAQPGDR